MLGKIILNLRHTRRCTLLLDLSSASLKDISWL